MQCPSASEDLLNLINDVEEEQMDDARAMRAGPAPAPQVQSRPAGPVPFPLGNNQAGPINTHWGPKPVETLFDTEVAYHANAASRVHTRYRSSTIHAVVTGPVQICGQTFEGIMDTGASDMAVSHAVSRRLGLMDAIIPSDITFLTAGGGSEA